jgi:hypothetical protein
MYEGRVRHTSFTEGEDYQYFTRCAIDEPLLVDVLDGATITSEASVVGSTRRRSRRIMDVAVASSSDRGHGRIAVCIQSTH